MANRNLHRIRPGAYISSRGLIIQKASNGTWTVKEHESDRESLYIGTTLAGAREYVNKRR